MYACTFYLLCFIKHGFIVCILHVHFNFYLLFFSIECFQGDDFKGTGKSVSADISGTEPDEILREFGISPVSGIALFAA